MDDRINWFKVLHSYKNLALEGRVEYLTCPDCEHRLVTTTHEDEHGTVSMIPRLECYTCKTIIIPGLDLLERIYAVVIEWHEKESLYNVRN